MEWRSQFASQVNSIAALGKRDWMRSATEQELIMNTSCPMPNGIMVSKRKKHTQQENKCQPLLNYNSP